MNQNQSNSNINNNKNTSDLPPLNVNQLTKLNSNNINNSNNNNAHLEAEKAVNASRRGSTPSILTVSKSNNIVGVHYKLLRKIGEGSFGVIFEGINLLNNQAVAIKFESRTSESPQLKDEFRSYKILAGNEGIPNVYYYGTENSHNILVIDLLGPSLEDLFDVCGRQFSIKTVAMVAKQMLYRIQTVHENSLVYRDIKPDNFLVGHIINDNKQIAVTHSKTNPHPATQIYIIDFGMAKYYRDPETLQHIPYKEKRSLSGTARYMSIHTHLGHEQSRRDDLESLGNVFMYFLRGSLPWQGLRAQTNKQKYKKIGEKKKNTPISELCMGFPEEFATYMNYVRKLAFDETPDYDYMRGLMDKVLKNLNCEDDGLYDWVYVIDKRRKEKEKERDRRNELIYPQNSSNKNLFSGKSQFSPNYSQVQPQHRSVNNNNLTPDLQILAYQKENSISRSKVNEIVNASYSYQQPLPIQIQFQNQLKNNIMGSNINNSNNAINSRNQLSVTNINKPNMNNNSNNNNSNSNSNNNNNNNTRDNYYYLSRSKSYDPYNMANVSRERNEKIKNGRRYSGLIEPYNKQNTLLNPQLVHNNELQDDFGCSLAKKGTNSRIKIGQEDNTKNKTKNESVSYFKNLFLCCCCK